MPPQHQEVEKFRAKAEENSQWSECDPMTLVAAARTKLYEVPQNQRDQIEGPIAEALSRFESLSRVALGSSQSFIGSSES